MGKRSLIVSKTGSNLWARTALVSAAATIVLSASAADSQTLRRLNGEAFNLVQDICRFDRYAASSLALFRRQRDFDAALQVAVANCPNVAVQLADLPVATITPSAFDDDGRGDGDSGGNGNGGGNGDGGNGGGGGPIVEPPDDRPGDKTNNGNNADRGGTGSNNGVGGGVGGGRDNNRGNGNNR
jgi:uncharacterized membrane protein YgcG